MSHPVFTAEDHCCACLASVEHSGFDVSGCEWCDRTVLITTDGVSIRLEGGLPGCDEPEVRFLLLPPVVPAGPFCTLCGDEVEPGDAVHLWESGLLAHQPCFEEDQADSI